MSACRLLAVQRTDPAWFPDTSQKAPCVLRPPCQLPIPKSQPFCLDPSIQNLRLSSLNPKPSTSNPHPMRGAGRPASARSLHPAPYDLHPTPITLHSTLYTLHNQNSTIKTQHSTLDIQRRGAGRPASTSQPSTMNPQPSTLNSQHSTFFFALILSSLELSGTKVFEPYIRALLGTASHFCEVVILKPQASTQGGRAASFSAVAAP